MAELTRDEKLAEIERMKRQLRRAVSETREEDRMSKFDLAQMRMSLKELQDEVGIVESADLPATARVRQIHMIGSKGY